MLEALQVVGDGHDGSIGEVCYLEDYLFASLCFPVAEHRSIGPGLCCSSTV